MRTFSFKSTVVLAIIAGLGSVSYTVAGDNELSSEEKQAGWQLLFNGRDLKGWKCNNGKPIATSIEDVSLVPYKSGGYIIVYDKPFSDFVLKCDVRWEDPRCNSGKGRRSSSPSSAGRESPRPLGCALLQYLGYW